TEWNMPYNYRVPQSDEDINACVASFNEDTAANKIIPTPSYFFDDKIATLRTMYHHLHSYKTIFSDTMYKHLPNTIQTLLDTSNIEKCIQQDAQHSLQFIASVLILYKEDKNICTEERLNSLAQDPLEQARLIAAYRPSVTLAPQGQAFTPS
ncbi:MAG: hypothetical protein Q8R79_02240, partial [Legionellaceae bacterium]|nr:hypothetical protein [Legionellaceae bacterium]